MDLLPVTHNKYNYVSIKVHGWSPFSKINKTDRDNNGLLSLSLSPVSVVYFIYRLEDKVFV